MIFFYNRDKLLKKFADNCFKVDVINNWPTRWTQTVDMVCLKYVKRKWKHFKKSENYAEKPDFPVLEKEKSDNWQNGPVYLNGKSWF